MSTCRRIQSVSITLHKTNSKRIKDLNVKLEALTLLEKTQQFLTGHRYKKKSSKLEQICRETGTNNWQQHFLKLKSFCMAKETIE